MPAEAVSILKIMYLRKKFDSNQPRFGFFLLSITQNNDQINNNFNYQESSQINKSIFNSVVPTNKY